MKRQSFVFMFIVLFVCCTSIFSLAEDEKTVYNSEGWNIFGSVYDGKFYISRPEFAGNWFKARRVLFEIDTETLSARRVFTVKNDETIILAYKNNIYFTYPDSFLNDSIFYPEHTWNKVDMHTDIQNKGNWSELSVNEEYYTDYFVTIDGVYKRELSNEIEIGYSRKNAWVYRCGETTEECILDLENVQILGHYSYLEVEVFLEHMLTKTYIYDYKSGRYFEHPNDEDGVTCSTILIDDYLYYLNEDRALIRYNIETRESNVVFQIHQESNIRNRLCREGSYLYVIDDYEEDTLHIYKYSCETNEIADKITVSLQNESKYSECLIYNDMLYIAGYSGDIRAYNLTTGKLTKIPLD